MKNRLRNCCFALLAASTLVASSPVRADDLRGAQTFLCAAREVFACVAGDRCDRIEPEVLNIPDFLIVDLASKELRTTAASAENRVSPIASVTRESGLLFLQGTDNGRAWSFLVQEATGALTASVAREALSVSAFGVCTPTREGAQR